jgi:hypothetical protein
MPENEFEKKVSSEMQELRVQAIRGRYGCAWQERIKKKRKEEYSLLYSCWQAFHCWVIGSAAIYLAEQKNDISKTAQRDPLEKSKKGANSESAKELNNSSTINQHTETTKRE